MPRFGALAKGSGGVAGATRERRRSRPRAGARGRGQGHLRFQICDLRLWEGGGTRVPAREILVGRAEPPRRRGGQVEQPAGRVKPGAHSREAASKAGRLLRGAVSVHAIVHGKGDQNPMASECSVPAASVPIRAHPWLSRSVLGVGGRKSVGVWECGSMGVRECGGGKEGCGWWVSGSGSALHQRSCAVPSSPCLLRGLRVSVVGNGWMIGWLDEWMGG